MKVHIINGSPRINGNTSLAIKEMEKIFVAQGLHRLQAVRRAREMRL